jgi:hypothetical protein
MDGRIQIQKAQCKSYCSDLDENPTGVAVVFQWGRLWGLELLQLLLLLLLPFTFSSDTLGSFIRNIAGVGP